MINRDVARILLRGSKRGGLGMESQKEFRGGAKPGGHPPPKPDLTV